MVAPAHVPLEDAPDGRVVAFRAPDGGTVAVRRSLTKAAMMALAQNAPRAIGFDELCDLAQARLGMTHAASMGDRNGLASDLLHSFAAGVVELHSTRSPFVTAPGTHPQASAVARLQAGRSAQVTNLRHEWITLDDEMRRVLPLVEDRKSVV